MTTTNGRLLRIVYLSRNVIVGSLDHMKWEIDAILEQSQFNNARAGVTGALVFNDGVFGQVLEGPMDAVEETFERIQPDPRHCDVTVLELKKVEELSFPRWSMGFVGLDAAAAQAFAGLAGEAVFEGRGAGADRIVDTLRGLALKREMRHRAA